MTCCCSYTNECKSEFHECLCASPFFARCLSVYHECICPNKCIAKEHDCVCETGTKLCRGIRYHKCICCPIASKHGQYEKEICKSDCHNCSCHNDQSYCRSYIHNCSCDYQMELCKSNRHHICVCLTHKYANCRADSEIHSCVCFDVKKKCRMHVV